MPKMISDTPLAIARAGINSVLEAGVAGNVHAFLVEDFLAAGAVTVEGEGSKPAPTPAAPAKPTDEEIQAAIQSLLDEGKDKAFGADGKPKVRSVEGVLGRNIDAADRDRVWDAMNG